MNSHLSWNWIALQATAPVPVALFAAWIFWRGSNFMIGNVVGSALIFATTVGAIGREYFALQAFLRKCIADELACPVQPDAFTRFAVYAFIGMFQIAALFALSLRFEERARRRLFSPEWQ
jgi:hypothetical protein